MKKLYATVWTSASELGRAISVLRKEGWEPKTLSGAISAIIKLFGESEELTDSEGEKIVNEITFSKTLYELKRGGASNV